MDEPISKQGRHTSNKVSLYFQHNYTIIGKKKWMDRLEIPGIFAKVEISVSNLRQKYLAQDDSNLPSSYPSSARGEIVIDPLGRISLANRCSSSSLHPGLRGNKSLDPLDGTIF